MNWVPFLLACNIRPSRSRGIDPAKTTTCARRIISTLNKRTDGTYAAKDYGLVPINLTTKKRTRNRRTSQKAERVYKVRNTDARA
jgi:hypothetical protein